MSNFVELTKDEQEALKPSKLLKLKNRKFEIGRKYSSYKFSTLNFSEERNKFLLNELPGIDRKVLGLGASEVGEFLVSPQQTFDQKILFKKKQFPKQMEYKFEDAHDAEIKIAKRFLDENLYNIKEFSLNKYKSSGKDKYTYFSKKNPFLKATIDAWMKTSDNENYVVEIKNTNDYTLFESFSYYNKTGDFSNTESFFKYYTQVQVGMHCTGVKKGVLICQYTSKFGTFIASAEFSYNEDLINLILEKIERYKEIVISYFSGTSLEETKISLRNLLDRRIKEKAFSFESVNFDDETFSKIKEIKDKYEKKLNEDFENYKSELFKALHIDIEFEKKNLIGIFSNKILKINFNESELDIRKKLAVEVKTLRRGA